MSVQTLIFVISTLFVFRRGIVYELSFFREARTVA